MKSSSENPGTGERSAKVKVPAENKDVRRALAMRLVKQIAFIVGWIAVVTVVAYFMGYIGDPIGMAFVELLWIFPFWKTKIWRWFTVERAYEGVVTEAKLDTNVESKSLGLPVMGNVRRQTVTVKKDDAYGGGEVTLKFVDTDDGSRIEYHAGDRVRHFWGSKYLQKLDSAEENICVVCGTMCGEGEHVCSVCGKSIVGNCGENFVGKTS